MSTRTKRTAAAVLGAALVLLTLPGAATADPGTVAIQGTLSRLVADPAPGQPVDAASGQEVVAVHDGADVPVAPGALAPGVPLGARVEAQVVGGRATSVTEAGPAPAARPTASATDVHKALVVMVEWSGHGPDSTTAADLTSLFGQVDTWYRTVSGSRVGFTPTVVDWTTIAAPSSTCIGNVINDEVTTNTQAALTTAGYHLADYDNLVIYFARDAASCSWAGEAQRPGNVGWLNGYDLLQTAIHELGHNFGLAHAATYDPSTDTEVEYGDDYDAMGCCQAGSFDSAQLAYLGWLPAEDIATVTEPATYGATASGSWDLSPIETSATGTTRAIKLVFDDVTYWLEVRRAIGVDTSGIGSSALAGGAGVQIRGADDPSLDPTTLYDGTPGTSPASCHGSVDYMPCAFADAAIPLGTTFALQSTRYYYTDLSVTLGSTVLPDGGVHVDVSVTRPTQPPSAPDPESAVAGNGQARLTWAAPTSDGGSPVTGYVVTPWVNGVAQTPITFASTATAQTVTGLTNGTTYTFTIAAQNAVGTGPAASFFASATPGPVPGPPGTPVAVAGNGQVQLSWSAPTALNGTTISDYLITPYIEGVAQVGVVRTTATSATINVDNGTTYTFTVAAETTTTTGPESPPSNAVTPLPAPATAPKIGTVTGGKAKATVTWTAPADDGGSDVYGYVVTPYVGSTAQTGVEFDTAATSEPVTGLTNGVAYTFKVQALTDAGPGASSGPSAPVVPPFSTAAAFVKRASQDVLGRVPTSAESTAEVAALKGGATPAAYLASLRRSTDATSNVDPATRLYFAYFLRIPDQGGLTYWIGRKRAGASLNTISNTFAGSAEFKAKYGALSNGAFVDLVYQNVLGRPGEASGVAYWTKQLDKKADTRGQVMVGFSESAEYKGKKQPSVDTAVTWIDLLGSSPDQSSFDTWVADLTTGGKALTDLAAALMADSRYVARVT